MSSLFVTLNQNEVDEIGFGSDVKHEDDSDECLSPILTNAFNVNDDFSCGKCYLLMTLTRRGD